MNKERILIRSFMSIRTYAILAVFAALMMTLLFSAGCSCSGRAAKTSFDGGGEYSSGCLPTCLEGRTANQDTDINEIGIGI